MSNTTFTVGEHVFVQTGQYRGDSAPRYLDATVTKVLKTRVVVEVQVIKNRVVADTTRTMRFVIPTYGDRYQEEGYVGDYYHNVLLVKDDEELAVRRASFAAQAEREAATSKARNAAAAFAGERWAKAADAEALIAELQAFIAAIAE